MTSQICMLCPNGTNLLAKFVVICHIKWPGKCSIVGFENMLHLKCQMVHMFLRVFSMPVWPNCLKNVVEVC